MPKPQLVYRQGSLFFIVIVFVIFSRGLDCNHCCATNLIQHLLTHNSTNDDKHQIKILAKGSFPFPPARWLPLTVRNNFGIFDPTNQHEPSKFCSSFDTGPAKLFISKCLSTYKGSVNKFLLQNKVDLRRI